MKRIAIYNHYQGCGKTYIATLLANWLEKEKKENVVLQVFDINATQDICEVVERESEGSGYYIMDFLWDDRIPKAFRYLLKKGMVDSIIIPIQINVWIRARALFTFAFLDSGTTYENLETKRPQYFCLWNCVPGGLVYDKNQKYYESEKAMVRTGHKVCSTRLPYIPSEECDGIANRRIDPILEEIKERVDDPTNSRWSTSWIEELEHFDELSLNRKSWLFDKMVENGLHDGTFTIPAPIDPDTGKPIELPPDPSDEEAYDAYWKKAGD